MGEIMAKDDTTTAFDEVVRKVQVLDRVAERYRSEGYEVIRAAGKGILPIQIDHLRESVDLIAHRGDEWVVVEVKRRDELYDINPLAIAIQHNLPEWRYDLVVYPPDGVDGIPLEAGEPSSEYVESLLKESQELLGFNMTRASLLVGWSAAESAMRTAARREKLPIGNGDPHFVLKTLYSNGIVSFDVYDKLRRGLDGRNRLVHGLAVNGFAPDDVRFVIESARQLLCPAGVSAEA